MGDMGFICMLKQLVFRLPLLAKLTLQDSGISCSVWKMTSNQVISSSVWNLVSTKSNLSLFSFHLFVLCLPCQKT